MFTRSILVLLPVATGYNQSRLPLSAICTPGNGILKRAGRDHVNPQRCDELVAFMRLQFDQVLDPHRLTAAFDASIGRNANQT